jgi:protein-tyrosine phosphatase
MMATSKRAHSRAVSPLSASEPVPKFLSLPLGVLNQKFKSINAHEASLRADPAAIFSHPMAVARNRYPDVHPWSHNRVHLHALPFPYINASPIDLGRPRENFIATQGPLERDMGLGHFWEMVWQEACEVIVMLTRVVEEGKEKCGVYYPETVGEVKELEGWGSVECVSLSEEFRTEIRELKVVKKSQEEGEERVEERIVRHFLFLGWPDYEIPVTREDQDALLELIRMSRFQIDEVSNEDGEKVTPPRIVHCSAGVGRTGTFIALDYLLQELDDGRFDDMVNGEDDETDSEKQNVDPVFETVKRLREQRMYMVYKPGQYAFIYQMLRQRWEARKKGVQTPSIGEEGLENVQVSPTKKRKLVQNGSGNELDVDTKDDDELDVDTKEDS